MFYLRCHALRILTIAALVATCGMLYRVGVQVDELTVELRRMNDTADRAMRMVE